MKFRHSLPIFLCPVYLSGDGCVEILVEQDVDDEGGPSEESSTETADVTQEARDGVDLPELDVVLLVQAEVHCGVDLILSVEVVLIKFLVFY